MARQLSEGAVLVVRVHFSRQHQATSLCTPRS